jgi:predicted nucleotidyltransferase
MKQASVQQLFAKKVKSIVSKDPSVIGLAAAGSWLSNEMDEWSDLDLILVTKEKIGGDKEAMLAYVKQLGDLLNGFTGDHVGEPRLLVCLYDDPLLHVDIKFLTLEEFKIGRVENPIILHDTSNQLQEVLDTTAYQFPYPDYQWIEDRFWIWVHYILLKIGRGEYFEAHDSISFLRTTVLGPLLHIRNGNLPRGVRKVEMQLPSEDLEMLHQTVTIPERESLLTALRAAMVIYQMLCLQLHTPAIRQQNRTAEKVKLFFEELAQSPL